jgi:glycosyltransferase involved in cell wall biosynthesis
MAAPDSTGALRIGIITDALQERTVGGSVRIANGGVGVYIYQLVSHLLQVDPLGKYFLIRFGPGRLDIYRHPRVKAVFLSQSRLAGFKGVFDLPHRRLAQELKLDVLHYPNQFGGAFLPRSIKRVVTLHDITPLLFPQMHPRARVMAYRLLARWSLNRCDRIIVDSNNTRHDLVEHGFARPGKIVTVPLGVVSNFATRPGVRPGLRHERSRPFMLTVGVLEPRKNHALLLEVLQRLHRQGEEIDLIIVGRDGWRWVNPVDRPEYANLRHSVQIRKDIPDDELGEIYKNAAVFVYPSYYEGFGLPILEAMACGTPVVASSTSSLPEVGGNAALYADPHDAEGFADKVLLLLRDHNLRQRMVAAGFERAKEFSWLRTARHTLSVYQSLCNAVTLEGGASESSR